MTDEILRRVQHLQRQARGLQDLMASLQAHASQRAAGYDATRSVHVFIGVDGLPTAIRVELGWRDQLAPQAMGDAVLEAFTAAVAEAMQAWSRALEQTSWRSRAAEPEAQAVHHGNEADRTSLPTVVGFAANRDPQEIAEDVLRASDRLRTQASGEVPVGVGADQSGNVSITLSRAGLQACSVQAAWASRQGGSALTAALSNALRTARTELDARAGQSAPDGFNQLVGEALAALQSIAETTRRHTR